MSLRTELEAAGLNVKVVDGWGTRGGAWAVGKPVGIMEHHTAAPVPYPVSKLYGDLLKANINTKPDGTVWLIAQKACNYSSGSGSSVVLSEVRAGQPPTQNARERGLSDDMGGNAYYFNFENDHAGDGGPLPQVQHDAIVAATRVVLDHYGLGPGNVVSHAEWTTRKNDPNWNGSNRAIEAIREALEDTMTPEQEAKLDAVLAAVGTIPKASADAVLSREWTEEGISPTGKISVLSALVKGYKNSVATKDLVGALDSVDEAAIAQAVVAEMSPALRAAVAAELNNLTMKAV
jgi:hypothetical protein